jgi:phage tail-like protein
MSVGQQDPFLGARFVVEIDGIPGGGAAVVTLPESRIVRQDDAETVQSGPLILQRALTPNADWYEWWDAARRSTEPFRRTVTILLLDAEGAPAWHWVFADSEPVAYRVSALDAMASAPVWETLELSVRGFEAFARPD